MAVGEVETQVLRKTEVGQDIDPARSIQIGSIYSLIAFGDEIEMAIGHIDINAGRLVLPRQDIRLPGPIDVDANDSRRSVIGYI